MRIMAAKRALGGRASHLVGERHVQLHGILRRRLLAARGRQGPVQEARRRRFDRQRRRPLLIRRLRRTALHPSLLRRLIPCASQPLRAKKPSLKLRLARHGELRPHPAEHVRGDAGKIVVFSSLQHTDARLPRFDRILQRVDERFMPLSGQASCGRLSRRSLRNLGRLLSLRHLRNKGGSGGLSSRRAHPPNRVI